MVENGLFSLTAKDKEAESRICDFCKGIMQKPENLYYNYKVVPHALEVLKHLKASGEIKLAVCSNSNNSLKRLSILDEFGFNASELFDAFVVSGDIGLRKPDAAVIDVVKK